MMAITVDAANASYSRADAVLFNKKLDRAPRIPGRQSGKLSDTLERHKHRPWCDRRGPRRPLFLFRSIAKYLRSSQIDRLTQLLRLGANANSQRLILSDLQMAVAYLWRGDYLTLTSLG